MADETLAAPGASGKEAAHAVDCGFEDEEKRGAQSGKCT